MREQNTQAPCRAAAIPWATALVCAVAWLTGAAATAAGGPAGQPGRHLSPQGWALNVPAGLGAVWQPASAAPATASKGGRAPQQASGTLLLVHQGTEIVRLDLYADATPRTPLQWVRAELPMAIEGARLQEAVATTAAVACTVADLERSPQRHQQRLAFFRLGDQMAQLTCQIGAGPAASGWCEAVRVGLEPPGAAASRRGGQR